MQTSASIAHVTSRVSRRLRKSLALAAALAGIAVTIGAMAQNAGVGGFHHGGHMHTSVASASDARDHVDAILQHVYAEVDASAAQQAQIAPLVQAAAMNLLQLHDQFHAEHAQMLTLLVQERIDRVALENSRAAQLAILDQASRQIVQLLADTADALTPAQRKALAEKLAAQLTPRQG